MKRTVKACCLILCVLFCAAACEAAADPSQEFFALLNADREAAGLQPLKWNQQLADVAKGRAEDMLQNSYYSHFSRSGQSPVSLLRKAGIQYAFLNEVIAQNYSPEAVRDSFRGSETHWNTLMSPKRTEAGIALVPGSRWGYMAVCLLITPKPMPAVPVRAEP